MRISWLTQGGFLFAHDGRRLVIDPYMSDSLEAKGIKRLAPFPLPLKALKPDALLCTHDHLDHLDPASVQMIAGAYPDCILAGSANAHRHFLQLGLEAGRCRLLRVGELAALAGFDLLPVAARHSDREAIGVKITAGGKRVYLSGDTEYDEGLADNPALKGLDLVLICINGRLGNMNLDEALKTVKALRPETALPMHYGLFAENTADPRPFIRECLEAGINSFEMQPGLEFRI